jgi:hypothetical protein
LYSLCGLEAALCEGAPEIFHTGRDSQFTAAGFTAALRHRRIRISMDGRSRWPDGVFFEQEWLWLKYELIYPEVFVCGRQLWMALVNNFRFCNHSRPHQATGRGAPAEVSASCGMEPVVGRARGSPKSPGFDASGQTHCFAVEEAFGLPDHQGASQENRATEGCDPNACGGQD